MADLAITATAVLKTASTRVQGGGVFGEAVTAGQAVYRKSSDRRWWKARASGTAEEAGSAGLGVALSGGAAGQPASVATGGDVIIGATVAVGAIYGVSANAGGIAPSADLAAGQRLSVLGYGKTAAIVTLDVATTGIIKG
jgi:hypothetical protein